MVHEGEEVVAEREIHTRVLKHAVGLILVIIPRHCVIVEDTPRSWCRLVGLCSSGYEIVVGISP